jgi:hypothetical protein
MDDIDDRERSRLSAGPQDDRLTLPQGAIIAFRQSGGLRFSTREVTVYRDGHVTWRRTGKLGAAQGERQLTSEDVADLQALIGHSDLFGLPTTIGRPSPDGYAYELIARVRRKSTSIELFDGSVPLAVEPLLARLKAILIVDEA